MAPTTPEIIAHRGTPRTLRENTLPGFLAALREGADGVELDVHATRDGVVVVHHDPVLGIVEPAELSGMPISVLSLAEIRSVALEGSAPGAPLRIPTLAEVLAAVGTRATTYIEIKAPGIEEAVLEEVARAPGKCAVHSFDHRVSVAISRTPQAPPTGILVSSYLLRAPETLHDAGARDYWCWWEFIDAQLVMLIHGAGGRVVAWTVNDAQAARALAAMGVDAVCTDLPGATRAALGG